jgi:hypothetical protein
MLAPYYSQDNINTNHVIFKNVKVFKKRFNEQNFVEKIENLLKYSKTFFFFDMEYLK